MSGFTTSWLDLREPADRAARDGDLLGLVAEFLDAAEDPLVVDLGCGTGSTLRAVAPRLAKPVAWRLVDADAGLLDEARRRAGGETVETVEMNLSGNVLFPFSDATLVTASALLDLVSEAWIARLVATLSSRRAALYSALTYDGTTEWDPVHPLDAAVLAAFNRDQRRDKGFGPALGPTAGAVIEKTLDRAGYRVIARPSPWRLGPDEAPLVAELARGMATAVTGEGGLDREAVDDWLAFRLEHAADGRCTVGHQDVFAVPM
jgi:SAM-dependent methyltransferase